jgi:cell division transport system permease protein
MAKKETPLQPPRRGAQQHRIQFADRRRSWRRHHALVARQALRRLRQTPLDSTMTLAVLAIALALPGFLLTALGNLQALTAGWDTEPRIALYMQTALSDQSIDRFSRELLLRDDLSSVELISREAGLAEFRSQPVAGGDHGDPPLPRSGRVAAAAGAVAGAAGGG